MFGSRPPWHLNSPGRFGPGRVRSRVLLPSGFSLLPSSFPLSACLRSKFPLVPSPLTCLRCKFSLLPSPLALRRLLPSSLGPVLSSLTSNGGAAPKKIACPPLSRRSVNRWRGPKRGQKGSSGGLRWLFLPSLFRCRIFHRFFHHFGSQNGAV